MEKLRKNPQNPNMIINKTFELLKKNIQRDDFRDPVIVRLSEDDGWFVEDGHNEVRAWMELGYKEV